MARVTDPEIPESRRGAWEVEARYDRPGRHTVMRGSIESLGDGTPLLILTVQNFGLLGRELKAAVVANPEGYLVTAGVALAADQIAELRADLDEAERILRNGG